MNGDEAAFLGCHPPAATCARALRDGDLRFQLELSCFEPSEIECDPISSCAVAYRIVGGGIVIRGTVFLTAPAHGHFDGAFGVGRRAFIGSFVAFQELIDKLASCFNDERRHRRGEDF